MAQKNQIALTIYQINATALKNPDGSPATSGISYGFATDSFIAYPVKTAFTANGVSMVSCVEVFPSGLNQPSTLYYTTTTVTDIANNSGDNQIFVPVFRKNNYDLTLTNGTPAYSGILYSLPTQGVTYAPSAVVANTVTMKSVIKLAPLGLNQPVVKFYTWNTVAQLIAAANGAAEATTTTTAAPTTTTTTAP